MKTFRLNLVHRLLICAFLVITHAPVAIAQNNFDDSRINITYAGMENDHLVFYVQVSNIQQEKMSCRLLDQEKNTLFEESFTVSRFEKKFLIAKENLAKINFRFTGKKYIYERDFNIQTRIIEEVTVSQSK